MAPTYAVPDLFDVLIEIVFHITLGGGSKILRYIRTFELISEQYCVLLNRRLKKAPPFNPARYIQTFDVISEVYCVLLRRKRRFEVITLYPNF